ncbi:hypothetical protein [Nonomuraea sp. SYSU D8015]|uniref:hypothetical protein n=1 Tax=Nonomuraea sp. SYSU D8015 TaxID=2593644 RepID=UPI0016605C08|nr:hypothetical protein [Nonomuraea sp. SYSU D8015]
MPALTDRLIPRPDASERHSIVINASRERVWDAVTRMRPSDIRLAKPLFAIRELASRLSGARPQRDLPRFTPLAEEPGREVVVGMIGQWWRLGRSESPQIAGAADFDAFDRPGYAKGTFTFLLEEAGEGRVRLVTETRVKATSPDARRAFLCYWAVIRPGSGLIRRMMLAAIRADAIR